jgi:hypothetical protein
MARPVAEKPVVYVERQIAKRVGHDRCPNRYDDRFEADGTDTGNRGKAEQGV